MERIAASRRERVPGIRGSSRLIVSGIVVALGATSFVVASAADIQIAPTLCSSSSSTIRGTAGNDVLVGTSSNDIIWGGGGDDVISGLQGNDRLCGVDGNDRLYGGSGDDYLDGGVGTDILRGDSGARDTCLNGEQRAGCELVGTTTPPPTTTTPTTAPATTAPTTTTTPPTTTPPTGRFNTLPVGATLPSEQQCAAAVRRMSENRTGNSTYNGTRGTTANTAYPRVTGNFTGTTDEILQWVACKWGIDEDLVRAQVAIESWWDQKAGGDLTSTQTNCHPDVRTASGQCPESIGLMQVRYVYHGTAFVSSNAIRSSAYNVDYAFANWRSCFEGQFTWLNTVERGAEYRSGDAMGCAGVWFSGRWRTPPAVQYIARVDDYLRTRVWTQASFGPSTPGGPTTTAPATTAPTTPPTNPPTNPPTTPATTAPTTPTTPAPTNPPTTPATTQPPTTTTTTTTTPPTTTQAPTTTTPPPAGGDFFADFNTPGQLQSLFRHGLWRRDDTLIAQTQWQADHSMACSAPDQKRTIHRAEPEEGFFECAQHIMVSEGDTSGYSIAWVSPDKTFQMSGPASVCWDINLTNMGTRQWFEVGVIPASAPDLFAEASIASSVEGRPEVAVYPRANYAVTLWSGPSAWLGKLGINGSINQANNFNAGSDVATRYPMCFTDNGAGTLTTTIRHPTTNALIMSYSRPGAFPTGPSKVMFELKYYTPTKDGAVISTTWHLKNVRVTQ